MTRACPRRRIRRERRSAGGEERPVAGDYAVTTPLQSAQTGALLNGEEYALGPELVRGRGRRGPSRSCRGGAAAQAGRSVRPDVGARRGAGPGGEVPAGRSRDGAGLDGGGDRAGGEEHERYRRAGAPGTGLRGRAERYHGAADAGAGRCPDPGQDRPGAGGGPRARLAASLREADRVPVAGRRREAAGGLAGHRPGRDADHRVFGQGGGGSHLEERLRLPSAGGRTGSG